jgi:hypothetical protein
VKKHPRTIVKSMDPKLSETDSAFAAAMVLIAATQVGTKADSIAKRTGLKREVVRAYNRRLREQGIFTKGGKIACDWFDKETGGVSFWCDVSVAEGLMSRV